MGWKNIKEHYRIGHTVQVTEKGICIGSPYIHDIIVIGLDGTIKKRHYSSINEELCRYMEEFDADPELLKRIATTPDTFTKSIKVYTYDGGDIVEKECETVGWPNVTHDGEMMYENTFSTNRDTVVEWAKANAAALVEICEDTVKQIEERLKDAKARLDQARMDVEKLKRIATTAPDAKG